MRQIGAIGWVALFGACFAPSAAHAVAKHKIEQVQKLVNKKGAMVGVRVHMLVEPEQYANFRINLAPQAKVPKELYVVHGQASDSLARKALSGMNKGYILQTLKERLAIPKSKANTTHEVYVDIEYGADLKPGRKVNILSAFSQHDFKPLRDGMFVQTHVFGAWDGPANSGDPSFILELPDAKAKLPLAQKRVVE